MGAAKRATFKMLFLVLFIFTVLSGMSALMSLITAPLFGYGIEVPIIGFVITFVLFFLAIYAREKGRE